MTDATQSQEDVLKLAREATHGREVIDIVTTWLAKHKVMVASLGGEGVHCGVLTEDENGYMTLIDGRHDYTMSEAIRLALNIVHDAVNITLVEESKALDPRVPPTDPEFTDISGE